ncbi:hypothetical protein Peur_006285 [Populus x canadensis]
MGLHGLLQHVRRANTGSKIVIGMLDTGIWPESESFSCQDFFRDKRVWHSYCINCRRELCYWGKHWRPCLRNYSRRGSPFSHCCVQNWFDDCFDADILAAFDDAIADGVDIISLSVGGSTRRQNFNDSIANGAFHAMKNGVLASISAGNSDPDPAKVSNVSPLFLPVAASTIDRKSLTRGTSIYTFTLEHDMHPIFYAGDVQYNKEGYNAYSMHTGSLDKKLVKRKIVLCDSIGDGLPA